MPNPNPKTNHLNTNRGKRPKTDRKSVSIQLTLKEKIIIEYIAKKFNLLFKNDGNISLLLQAIASNKLSIFFSPPGWENQSVNQSSRERFIVKLTETEIDQLKIIALTFSINSLSELLQAIAKSRLLVTNPPPPK